MTGQRKAFTQLRQALAIGPADTDPVFRRALEKVHCALFKGQQLGHQATAQAKACKQG
ncbi:hypothetical protein D3C79_1104980 [compost metagenome]